MVEEAIDLTLTGRPIPAAVELFGSVARGMENTKRMLASGDACHVSLTVLILFTGAVKAIRKLMEAPAERGSGTAP